VENLERPTLQETSEMQQIFRLFNLFNSALHVSGDKFAHPQELFLTVYTGFGTMQVSVHCTKSCIYSQKELLRMGESVAGNM